MDFLDRYTSTGHSSSMCAPTPINHGNVRVFNVNVSTRAPSLAPRCQASAGFIRSPVEGIGGVVSFWSARVISLPSGQRFDDSVSLRGKAPAGLASANLPKRLFKGIPHYSKPYGVSDGGGCLLSHPDPHCAVMFDRDAVSHVPRAENESRWRGNRMAGDDGRLIGIFCACSAKV